MGDAAVTGAGLGPADSYRLSVLSVAAMSSYLYIVKSELPLVIQAFLKADPDSE